MASALSSRALDIGIMPLVDAAPIIVAERLGYFAEQGLHVRLHREHTWAAVRDKLIAGVLDAAPVLAPMPIASALALDGVGMPLVTGIVLSRNGNAITISNALHQQLQRDLKATSPLGWARAIASVIARERRTGAPPLVFAHVFPSSSHGLQLRYWLAAAGVDIAHDITFVVVPPSSMADQLAQGRIDGFCVGAPWSAVSRAEGFGHVLLPCSEVWPDSPEKVLGVTRAWAHAHPDVHVALVRALLDATHWLGCAENLDAAVRVLRADGYLDVAPALLREGLCGVRFGGGDAQRPWQSEMLWLGTQLRRWSSEPATSMDLDRLQTAACAVCARDVYDAAAHAKGMQIPEASLRMEGPWFDGMRFDPWNARHESPARGAPA